MNEDESDRCETEGCDIRPGDLECRRCGAEPPWSADDDDYEEDKV